MPQPFTWTTLFQKQLRGIDRLEAKRILDAIAGLRLGLGDIDTMKGSNPPAKRLRVGGYRVIYLEGIGNRFHLLSVGTRGDVYKR